MRLLPQEENGTGLPQWVSKRGARTVSLSSSLPQGAAEAQKHKDVKGFTSKILRFMKVKVTADGHNFWLNQWWMDRDVK